MSADPPNNDNNDGKEEQQEEQAPAKATPSQDNVNDASKDEPKDDEKKEASKDDDDKKDCKQEASTEQPETTVDQNDDAPPPEKAKPKKKKAVHMKKSMSNEEVSRDVDASEKKKKKKNPMEQSTRSLRGKKGAKEEKSLRGRKKGKPGSGRPLNRNATGGGTTAQSSSGNVPKPSAPKPVTPPPAGQKKPPPAPAAPREKLKDGEIISGPTKWRVIKLLGSGGFGDVYKVTADGKKEYAMKTEMCEGDKRMLRLKVEVTVLNLCHQAKKRHFVEMLDRGKNDKFKYVVMSLVGPSLEDIRKKFLPTQIDPKNRNIKFKYTAPTVMQVGMQTLQSLKDLHELGWIHRDIKPANFAVGLDEKEQIVYMLDFGIAKKIFIGNTTVLKKQRIRVKFLGTLRFASRACHLGREQGRHDDVETWIYMLFDLLDEECGLPWKKAADRSKVPDYKEMFFKLQFTQVFRRIPPEFGCIIKYINGLTYESNVDYKYINATLINIARNSNYSMSAPLDWIGKLGEAGRTNTVATVTPEEESSDLKQSGSDECDSAEEKSVKGKKNPAKGKPAASKPTTPVATTPKKVPVAAKK